MLDRLRDYADRHGLTLKARPARIGELAPGMDCHVLGVNGDTIYAIYRAQVRLLGVQDA